jgi:hypothetical protein
MLERYPRPARHDAPDFRHPLRQHPVPERLQPQGLISSTGQPCFLQPEYYYRQMVFTAGRQISADPTLMFRIPPERADLLKLLLTR